MRFIFITLCCFVLSACGFHLQTKDQFPPQLRTMYLDSDQPYSHLMEQLRTEFVDTGIVLVSNAKEAKFTLYLSNESFSTSQTSLTTSQQTRQYNVTYSFNFQIKDSTGNNVIPIQGLSLSRPLTLLSNQLLTNNSQLTVLKQQMEQELINQLLNRIESRMVRTALRTYRPKHENSD